MHGDVEFGNVAVRDRLARPPAFSAIAMKRADNIALLKLRPALTTRVAGGNRLAVGLDRANIGFDAGGRTASAMARALARPSKACEKSRSR